MRRSLLAGSLLAALVLTGCSSKSSAPGGGTSSVPAGSGVTASNLTGGQVVGSAGPSVNSSSSGSATPSGTSSSGAGSSTPSTTPSAASATP